MNAILIATIAANLLAGSAALAVVMTAPPNVAGDYCLTESIQNGQDAITGRPIPRTNTYRRGTDCHEDDRVGITFESGSLKIEGHRLDLTFEANRKETVK